VDLWELKTILNPHTKFSLNHLQAEISPNSISYSAVQKLELNCPYVLYHAPLSLLFCTRFNHPTKRKSSQQGITGFFGILVGLEEYHLVLFIPAKKNKDILVKDLCFN
jgi:hypothetical protein